MHQCVGARTIRSQGRGAHRSARHAGGVAPLAHRRRAAETIRLHRSHGERRQLRGAGGGSLGRGCRSQDRRVLHGLDGHWNWDRVRRRLVDGTARHRRRPPGSMARLVGRPEMPLRRSGLPGSAGKRIGDRAAVRQKGPGPGRPGCLARGRSLARARGQQCHRAARP